MCERVNLKLPSAGMFSAWVKGRSALREEWTPVGGDVEAVRRGHQRVHILLLYE